MGRNADLVQPGHQIFRDPVVEHALAGDDAALLVVEGAGIVLEILHQRARLRALEQDLRLAFINAAAPGHGGLPNKAAEWRNKMGTSLGPMRSALLRSEEHTSALQSLMRISYAVFCLKKKKRNMNTI